MKAYQEWNEKNCSENCHVQGPGHMCGSCRGLGGREDIWRAALKWARREAIASDERGDISRVVIDRELGEEE